jgi:hypothetical protein
MMNVFVKDIRKYHEFLTSKEGTKVIEEPTEQSWGGIHASTELYCCFNHLILSQNMRDLMAAPSQFWKNLQLNHKATVGATLKFQLE